MEDVLEYFKGPAFYETLLVLTILIVVLIFIKKFLIKKVAYTTKGEQHANTFIGVVFSLLQYFVGIVSAFVILKVNGVDITGILAGLGIFATIVGLALQDTLKDLISGINIYNNNFYKVGDIVKYEGELCEVKYFNARVTKFRSMGTDATYTVCNSSIKSIQKVKDVQCVVYVFPYDADSKKIDKMFEAIVPEVEALKGPNNVVYSGISGFEPLGVKYAISFRCNSRYAGSAKGLINKRIYEAAKKAGIRIMK